MAAEIRLSTVGTLDPVVIDDFGARSFAHPTTNFNLLTEFSEDEIKSSADLQALITAGHITITDELGNSIDPVAESSPHKHVAADTVSGEFAAPRLPVLVGDTGAGGVKGAAPAPAAGDAAAGKFLKANATWAVPPIGAKAAVPIIFEAMGDFEVALQVGGRVRNRTGNAWTILDVSIHREEAGTSGSTTVDVNVNGTTIYTTQSNRPSVAFGAGDDAEAQGGTPDVASVPNGSYLSMDIDAVEGGDPENLLVVVTVREA